MASREGALREVSRDATGPSPPHLFVTVSPPHSCFSSLSSGEKTLFTVCPKQGSCASLVFLTSQKNLTILSSSRRQVKVEVEEKQNLHIYCALSYNALLVARVSFFKSLFKCQLPEVFQNLTLVCLSVCVLEHIRRGQRTTYRHGFSLGDKTHIIRLGGKCLHRLSHLSRPQNLTFYSRMLQPPDRFTLLLNYCIIILIVHFPLSLASFAH